MDPRSNPSDEQIATWAQRYGTTGVKTYDLSGTKNRGCVAVYREMSMADRQLLARLEETGVEYPGAYDYQRMMVSNCLLYPTVEAYPHPPFAAAELFSRIRQHGHGPLYDDEEMVTEDEQKGQIPGHIVRDMRSARRAAYKTFHSPKASSIYTDLIIELASGPNGTIDPQTLDYLWGLSPGRLRDLSARIEQAHANIRKEAMEYLKQDSDMDGEEKQARAKHVESTFGSPFAPIDRVVGDAATPKPDEDEEQPEQEQPQRQTSGGDDDLPPNRPPTQEEWENMMKQANRNMQ